MTLEQVKEVLEEIKRRTKMTAYRLTIVPDRKPDIFDSKFGGVPYWNQTKEYPKDSKGEMLMLLAQINLAQADADERLPKEGMLQFFIRPDDVYGLDFDSPDVQDTFRAVYHEKIDQSTTLEQVLALHPPINTDEDRADYSPVWKELALDIEKQEKHMGDNDYRFDALFDEIAKEKFGEGLGNSTLYSILDSDDYEELMEDFDTDGHWLFGYPFFTQYDPRENSEPLGYYDTMLFQMDSDYGKDNDYVMWGDAGVANFFINHEDLEKRDFSNILYNWDCC